MAQPIGERDWRFCDKCYCLWLNKLQGNGVCPAGGQHVGTGSYDYILVANPVGLGSGIPE